MRLGFYTYGYTDRLRMPVAACLERVPRAGYSGIDVSGTDGASDDPRSVLPELRRLTRRTADRLGLRIEAVVTHAQLADSLYDPKRRPLDLAGTVDLAVELGADVVTFHMGGYPPGTPRDAVWTRVVTEVRRAADRAAARHVALAVDGIWPTWVDDSPDTLDRLFRDVDSPAFGVNFDPSYLTLIGVDPAAFVRWFARRVVHAHLKDHAGKYPRWTHLIPGRGTMNYSQVFAALRAVGFAGSCAVECDTSMEFGDACDSGYAAMTGAALKAGVRFAAARRPVRDGTP
jgi:sugar phosphate isomerase/epimerase